MFPFLLMYFTLSSLLMHEAQHFPIGIPQRLIANCLVDFLDIFNNVLIVLSSRFSG